MTTPKIAVSLLLGSLFLGACSTPRKTAPAPATPAPKSVSPIAATEPVIHEGPNYRYVERVITTVEAEQAPPYWLTSFDNNGRERVLPTDNQGVALVLQAPVGVPKLLVEEKNADDDRIHLRIVNRGPAPLELDVTCLNRNPPMRRHAVVIFDIGARSMIDLALDTPAKDRGNLLVRVR